MQEWREWLAAHHTRRTGVWLVTWRAGSGGPQIGYDESVEQALCFGWVDSKGRTLDDRADDAVVRAAQGAQRMGPVEQGADRRLTAAGLMEPAGLALVEAAKADGSWTLLDAVEDLVVPDDLGAAFDAAPPAREHFEAFPRSVRRSDPRVDRAGPTPGDAGPPGRRDRGAGEPQRARQPVAPPLTVEDLEGSGFDQGTSSWWG